MQPVTLLPVGTLIQFKFYPETVFRILGYKDEQYPTHGFAIDYQAIHPCWYVVAYASGTHPESLATTTRWGRHHQARWPGAINAFATHSEYISVLEDADDNVPLGG